MNKAVECVRHFTWLTMFLAAACVSLPQNYGCGTPAEGLIVSAMDCPPHDFDNGKPR